MGRTYRTYSYLPTDNLAAYLEHCCLMSIWRMHAA